MSSELARKVPRRFLLLGACVVAAALAAGCASTRPEAVADRDCPGRPPALYASLDVSDSGRSDALVAERLAGLTAVLTDTAACGGRARVVAFSASAAATETLVDRDLKPEGATRRAQLRRVPRVVDEAMAEVRTALDQAAGRLPSGGTDVLAQLRLATEFHAGVGDDRPLQVVVLTDGIAGTPVDLNRADLDPVRAGALADGVTVADLAGADVTFAGIGRPAGQLPPTVFVDGLKSFYERACARSGAARCTVTSAAPVGGAR